MRRFFYSLLLLCTLSMAFGLNPLYAKQVIENPSLYYDHLSRGDWKAFGTKLANQLGLRHLLTGSGAMVEDPNCSWCFVFTSPCALTLEEARPLALKMADEIWNFAETNPAFGRYIDESNVIALKLVGRKNYAPLSRNDFGYKLSFWDAQANRPLAPYLAQVTLQGSSLLYFYADSTTQALLPPLKETLDEARALLFEEAE